MADGRVTSMCAGRVSVVFALAAAVHAIGLDTSDHHLDGEYYPNVHRLASAHTWTSVCASGLDCAAGVWICRNDCCNHPVAPNHSTGGAAVLDRLAALGPDTHQGVANIHPRNPKPPPVIQIDH